MAGVLRAIRELHTETEALFDAVATRRPSTDDRRAQIIGVSDRPAELRAEIWDPDRGDAGAVLDSVSRRSRAPWPRSSTGSRFEAEA